MTIRGRVFKRRALYAMRGRGATFAIAHGEGRRRVRGSPCMSKGSSVMYAGRRLADGDSETRATASRTLVARPV